MYEITIFNDQLTWRWNSCPLIYLEMYGRMCEGKWGINLCFLFEIMKISFIWIYLNTFLRFQGSSAANWWLNFTPSGDIPILVAVACVFRLEVYLLFIIMRYFKDAHPTLMTSTFPAHFIAPYSAYFGQIFKVVPWDGFLSFFRGVFLIEIRREIFLLNFLVCLHFLKKNGLLNNIASVQWKVCRGIVM